jgi:hypothetical protein
MAAQNKTLACLTHKPEAPTAKLLVEQRWPGASALRGAEPTPCPAADLDHAHACL